MAKVPAALALVKRFIDVDPQQAAMALEGHSAEEAAALARSLPETAAAACLERARPAFAAKVLELLAPQPADSILERLPPDHVADIFRSFSEGPRRAALERMSPELLRAVQELFAYPEDSAGRIMRIGVLAFHKDLKVREAIARLRALGDKRPATYAYVVGPEQKLLGVLNMRDLLLAGPDAALESITRADVVSVPAFTDREELVHLAKQSKFISFPVVDAQGRLIGAVKNEDILETSEEEATEDIQMLFGGSPEERPFSPVSMKVARRLPWLYVNLATAFIAAAVVALFQDLIGRIAVLAVFLPVVAGQGGNAGIQSLSVVLRGLVMREVRPQDALRLIGVEMGVGLLNGLAVGSVTALAAWLWRGNPVLGLVVGLAMVVNMVAAGLAGAAIPVAMKRMGLDPAQSSGIFLTTVTDVVGFFSFLGLAALFQSRLL